MKHSIKSLIGFTLSTIDDEIGKVKDFYFDDDTWTIRYLVVDTGNWLAGRVVLLSTEALLVPDWENKTFPVNLTKDQIKNSPDINTDLPVSRQEEIKLNLYFPWVQYWNEGYSQGLAIGADPLAIGLPEALFAKEKSEHERHADKHLRSTHKVTGYNILATDGEIGDVEDFVIEESSWKINFVIIDTGRWFPGKKVLLPPDKIKTIDWNTGTLTIDSSVDDVKHSPSFDFENQYTEVYSLVL